MRTPTLIIALFTITLAAHAEGWPPPWYPLGIGPDCRELEETYQLPEGTVSVADAMVYCYSYWMSPPGTWAGSYHHIHYFEPGGYNFQQGALNITEAGVDKYTYIHDVHDIIGPSMASSTYGSRIYVYAFLMSIPYPGAESRWVRAMTTGSPNPGPGTNTAYPIGIHCAPYDWVQWYASHDLDPPAEEYQPPMSPIDTIWWSAQFQSITSTITNTYNDLKEWFESLWTPSEAKIEKAEDSANRFADWGPLQFIENFLTYHKTAFEMGAGGSGDDPDFYMWWQNAPIYVPPGIDGSDGSDLYAQHTAILKPENFIPSTWRVAVKFSTTIIFIICTALAVYKLVAPRIQI